MTPDVRFTITEATLYPGGTVVVPPVGWNELMVVLKRSEHHSLVEACEGEFVWVGTGFTVLQNIVDNVGARAKVILDIGIKYDILGDYEDFFSFDIDVSEFEELTKKGRPYKLKAPLKNTNVWTKTIARMDVPVDLMSETDLDGNAADAADKITLPLPSQKIRQNYEGRLAASAIFYELAGIDMRDKYIQVASDNVVLEELKNKWNIPTIKRSSVDNIADSFTAELDGSYTFDILYRVSKLEAKIIPPIVYPTCGTSGYEGYYTSTFLDFYYQINDETPILFSSSDSSGALLVKYSQYETLFTTDLKSGDTIKVYGKFDNSADPFLDGDEAMIVWGTDKANMLLPAHLVVSTPPSTCDFLFEDPDIRDLSILDATIGEIPSYFKVTGDTVYTDSSTDSVLLKETFKNILAKITGDADPLTSNAMDTCKGNYALQKIMHVRGYLFDDKPFTISLKKAISGAFPALGLGFGYTNDGKFEIENVADFYNGDPTKAFTKIDEITRSFDDRFFIGLLKLGFQKWSAESEGGIDDPQTVKQWRSLDGKTVINLSEFYAASLGIERARRNRVEITKDFRNDEEICIIAVIEGGSRPEVGTDFDSSSDILNPDTRYNFRLFVSRILKRWQSYYECGLPTGGYFYFVDGEGNFRASVKFDVADCEVQPEDSADGIAENDDFQKSAGFLFKPFKYSAQGVACSPEKYKIIRENRKNSIALLYDGVFKNVLIDEIRYPIFKGKMDVVGIESATALPDWLGTFTGEFSDEFD